MTQQLRAQTTFLEKWGSVPGIHMVVHICLKLQFQRNSALFMPSKAMQYTDLQSSKMFVVKKVKVRM